MTDAIKLAIDALEAGLDCAQEVAHRTHEELKGYKPHRHAAVDADVSKIEAALAALRAQPATTVPDNMQDWKGMDGTIAWHLIERHADNWSDVGKMMGEWLAANQVQPDMGNPITAQPDHIVDASEMVDHSELVKNAARYLAIRDGLEVDPNNSGIVVSLIDDFGGETLRGEQADKAIDDAMAAIGETME